MRQSIGRFVFGLVLVTGVGAGTGLGAALVAPGIAGAATTFTVNDAGDFGLASPGETTCTSTNTVDSVPTCTLRAAIEASNNMDADASITLPDPTTLTPPLNASAYVLNDAANGQLLIADSGGTVTIDGAGQTSTVIEANTTFGDATTRVLKVNTGDSADISGVTIQNGNASASGEVGGGILNCGTLLLSNSTVTSNETNAGPGGGIYGELGTTTLDGDTVIGNSGADNGGGIYAEGGTMTLNDTDVNDNAATDTGGGIFIEGQDSAATSFTMDDGSEVAGNQSDGDGAGIDIGGTGNTATDVNIDASAIDGNTLTDGDGGGIAQDADSTLTVTNTVIDANTASSEGGGVFLQGDSNSVDSFSNNDHIGQTGDDSGNTAAEGGGVYINGVDPSFTDADIEGNTASDSGGGVYIEGGDNNSFTGGNISDNTVVGGGCGGGVFIDFGTNAFSGVSIDSNQAQDGGCGGGVYVDGGTNTFTGTTVDSNSAIPVEDGTGQGGGFYFDFGTNAFIGGSINSNNAYDGGGAYLDGGTETFTQADISSNTASEAGAGLYIFVENTDDPTTVTSSTISQNTAAGTSGNTEVLGDGGGILAENCDEQNQINLTNDTIADNTASGIGGGYYGTNQGDCVEFAPNHPAAKSATTGHIVAGGDGVTNFVFDTIDANTSGEGGGNINTDDDSTLEAAQTIIADGVSDGIEGDNCTFIDGGTLTSLGYNLIDDTTCGTAATGDIIGQSPQLGALGDNGGPTSTELPASTSPAVGAVPANVCTASGVTTDQRGNARGAGLNGSCTIGSVEVAVAAPPSFNPNGYRLVANEGGIFDFGLNFNGSLANNHLNAPIVGIANSPGPNGYLMAGGDGGVFALGGANFYGSLGGQTIPSPISAIAAPPSENGYWLIAQNGKIYNFGAVPALPALSVPAGAHIVGAASTQDGGGAWLTDNLGDVYAEGDALYEGGLGGVHLNAPIVGIAAAASGQGYVLAATDGGVFNYGTQHFFGSVPGSLAPGQKLNAPVVGIAVTHSGNGYWLVGTDGGVFNYGDAPFLGSIYTAIGNHPLNGPIVGIQHLGELPPS